MKLFIIPWVMLSSSVHSQNAPNPQLVDIPFYQFLQRQNQINNAILLNNAMLANSLGAVPNEHRLRIPNAIPFHAGSLQTSLPSNPALFQNFPQTVPAVPATGLNRLGIYDVLNRGLDPMNAALVPTQVVREELVKKLSEAKLIAENSTQAGRPNTTAKSLSSTESTVEAVTAEESRSGDRITIPLKRTKPEKHLLLYIPRKKTDTEIKHHPQRIDDKMYYLNILSVTAEESRSGDRITIPLKRTKPEKHLLLYIPRKKTDTEIKHHPQRIDDKSAEDRTDFVEAEILTSQMHLPIEERYDDERSDDDPSAATNEPDTSDLSGEFLFAFIVSCCILA
ncbi:unnamed protein product [Heligmosomoides polygyrus]|uniref:DM5 domain-containing protein n=1 Tax=Heligmosomoides polygyrus TaxID=6339 RepID=A0A3P8AUV1_HELPZ|nr:unnamed protein product [Heligmosomoides polygyrus]